MPSYDPNFSQMEGFQQQGQGALTGLTNLDSSFSGLNNATDVRSRYGIKDTKSMFDPLFKSLASNRARRMQGSVMRAGRNASPEMTFSNVEGDYENGLQGLLGSQAQADQDQQKFIASLLGNAQGARDTFGLNKFRGMGDMASGLFRNNMGMEQMKFDTSGPSFWDIAGSLLGAGAKVGGAALGAPGNPKVGAATNNGVYDPEKNPI
jgi:hypothetical protein